MATNRAKAHVYGGKEKKRLVAAKKKDVFIADRVTALKAMNFIYGSKESQRLTSVIDSNIYVEDVKTTLNSTRERQHTRSRQGYSTQR